MKAGWCDESTVVTGSAEDAMKLASTARRLDEYSVITVAGNVVAIYTARSQSVRRQGKKDFETVKQRVLDIVSGLIGVSADDLSGNADRAA